MDGFTTLVRNFIVAHGIPSEAVIVSGKGRLNIPGFFRPTKSWDLLVIDKGRLVAMVEFKSQVGPSFGNNFNNRVEEAIGNATDVLTAYREGVFGESSKPFLGYIFVLEKCDKSTTAVRFSSEHFPAMEEFRNTSYARRYEIFCRKLVQEQLYDAAALVLSEKKYAKSGKFSSASPMTSLDRFFASLKGRLVAHISE